MQRQNSISNSNNKRGKPHAHNMYIIQDNKLIYQQISIINVDFPLTNIINIEAESFIGVSVFCDDW